MVKLRYVGDLPETTVWGYTFHKPRWTASHGFSEAQIAVLKDNPTFEYDPGEAAAEPART